MESRGEEASGPDEAVDLEAAERVHSRTDSNRPRLRIKLPSSGTGSRNGSSTPQNTADADTEKAGGVRFSEAEKSKSSGESLRAWLAGLGFLFLFDFSWMTKNMEFAKLKPVLRSAVGAWVSLLLIIIYPSEKFMGQVSGTPASDQQFGSDSHARPALSFSSRHICLRLSSLLCK